MDTGQLILQLELSRHPEGGWYRETYRSTEKITANGLPERYDSARSFGTAIYFLLESGDFSSFHRLKSDEIWHFYSGATVHIYMISEDGSLSTLILGSKLEEGENFQAVIPANCWFAAEPAEGVFSLVGCTVAPGFDFADFELADRFALTAAYPQHTSLIARMTRQ